jgi:outer membrane protein TolC
MKTVILTFIVCMGSLVSLRAQQDLDSYLEIGAENNLELKARFKEYQSALERIPQASSLPDPLFSFGYFISPVETRVGPQQAKLGIMQMLPWFGTLNARNSAAEAVAQVSFENFIHARNNYFLKVRLAWYDLYEQHQNLRISEENLQILRSWENLVLKKFEGGLASMVDVLRVQMMITELETRILDLEENINDQKEIFNLLLNREVSERVEVDFQLLYPERRYEINQDSLVNNPVMEILNARKLAQEKLLEVDNLTNKPNIGIGLDYVAVGPAINDIPDSGKDILMPMVSLSLPIYGKKNRSRIRERELSLESLDLYRENLENKLESDLKSTLNTYEDSERNYGLYKNLTEKSDQALRVLVTDYSSANKDFEELLRMQQLLLTYELALEKSIVERYKAEAKLNYIFNK